jgi:hypothetical protein
MRYNSVKNFGFLNNIFSFTANLDLFVHYIIFIFSKPFLTSSSHPDLGFHYWSTCKWFPFVNFLFVCPTQLNHWDLTQYIMIRCFIISSSFLFILIPQILLSTLVSPNISLNIFFPNTDSL